MLHVKKKKKCELASAASNGTCYLIAVVPASVCREVCRVCDWKTLERNLFSRLSLVTYLSCITAKTVKCPFLLESDTGSNELSRQHAHDLRGARGLVEMSCVDKCR